ncbi:MAG: MaoC/PaaZ C-terminal domain-containing protein [Acidimicrobiales bacterium]|nr:MaoC/PaaZ C-terminal domain-containing protein [Acidimicrobiales bacterium]
MNTAHDAAIGEQIPGRSFGPVTRMDFIRFSAATADPNRVHIEEDVAKAAGLPSVIGSGGIVGGVMSDVVTAWAGLGTIRRVSGKITFPLFPGTTVVVTGEVTGREERDGAVTLEVKVQATDENATPLGENTYWLELPAPG